MTNTTIPANQQPANNFNKPSYGFEVPLFIVVLLAVVISKARGGNNNNVGNSTPNNNYSNTQLNDGIQYEVIGHSTSELIPLSQQYDFNNTEAETMADSNQSSQVPVAMDLITDLAKKLGRNIVYGAPGTGKDFFLSHVYRAIKRVHGNKATLFILDCKADPKETGYFQGVVDSKYFYRKSVSESNAKDVFIWLQDALADYDSFDAKTGYKVLVINELAAVNSKLSILPKDKELGIPPIKWWIDKLSGYGSSGDSKGVSLFFASQNGHNEGIKLNGGDKSLLTPFVLASTKEMTPTKLILQAQIIPDDKKIGSDEMQRLCDKSPVKRCIYHGVLNKWLPMPELENFSGYNRDEREFTQRPGQTDALTDEERESLNSRTKTATTQSEILIQKLEVTTAKSLEAFITSDLNIPPDKVEEVYKKILDLLAATDRMDLFTKFDD